MILLFASAAFAQETRKYEFTDASKYFDIRVRVDNCKADECSGPAVFSFYKKGRAKPYQVIDLPKTIDLGWGTPSANNTNLYDEQSMINVDDFNFDGMDDLAICNGSNGSYGMPSYNIYLSDRAAGKFVYNKAFSDLGHHLGMFTVDEKAKMLETFDKSGCCYHITERYKVINNRPVKVYVFEEDATRMSKKYAGKVVLTTKTLVGRRWKTSVKVVNRKDYYGDQ